MTAPVLVTVAVDPETSHRANEAVRIAHVIFGSPMSSVLYSMEEDVRISQPGACSTTVSLASSK